MFVDLANDKDELRISTDLVNNYFPYLYYHYLFIINSYKQDVHISSNSWGSIDVNVYDNQCKQVDQFVWEHNDMTILYAAGNSGDKGYECIYFLLYI